MNRGRETLKNCNVHFQNIIQWDIACKELRAMYKTCLALQSDIVCEDGNQAWYFRSKAHKAERTDAPGETHPEPLNVLLNTVARFEVSRLNQGQPVYGPVAMEYVDNNAYEILENPEGADYDMWDCCVVQLVSYGKPNQLHPAIPSERVKLQGHYDKLLDLVYRRTGMDLSARAPPAWPELSFLTEDERTLLLDTHHAAPPLRFICDHEDKLVQRLLRYTKSGLWLSEEDKDWHYPLLVTIRETTKNWRSRKTEKHATRNSKEEKQGQRQIPTSPVSVRQTFYTGMERRILVVIQGILAGSGKHLDRFVLAWSRRHNNNRA